MALLDRVANYDSLLELEGALEDRYWDALACGVEQRNFGACYLLGYSMEIAMKVAYYRNRHVDEEINLRIEREAARQMACARGIRNLHDISFWAESLIVMRIDEARPLDPRLSDRLLQCARIVDENWSVEMRYRPSIPCEEELHRVLEAVDWVRVNLSNLWS